MIKLYIGGIGGCGKSTAGELLSRRVSFPFFVGSEVRMKFAGVTTREELLAIPLETRREMRRTAFREVYEANSDLIMDGHYFLTDVDLEHLTHYLLVDVDVERAVVFRRNDLRRERSLREDDIRAEITELSERVSAFERNNGIKVNRIRNNDTIDTLAGSVEQLFTSLRSNGCER